MTDRTTERSILVEVEVGVLPRCARQQIVKACGFVRQKSVYFIHFTKICVVFDLLYT